MLQKKRKQGSKMILYIFLADPAKPGAALKTAFSLIHSAKLWSPPALRRRHAKTDSPSSSRTF